MDRYNTNVLEIEKEKEAMKQELKDIRQKVKTYRSKVIERRRIEAEKRYSTIKIPKKDWETLKSYLEE